MWLRGKLAAKMKTTINDPRLLDLTLEQAEISLAFFMEEESEQVATLEGILGLRWTRESVLGMSGGEESREDIRATNLDFIRYPLTLALRPELIGDIKSRFSTNVKSDDSDLDVDFGMPHDRTGGKSLAYVPKDEFIARMGGRKPAGADPYLMDKPKEFTGFKQRQNPIRLGK